MNILVLLAWCAGVAYAFPKPASEGLGRREETMFDVRVFPLSLVIRH